MAKKKKRIFWKIYILCVVICLIAMGSVWWLLWTFLKEYENNQPQYTMDKIIGYLDEGMSSEVISYIELPDNEFETRQNIEEYLSEYLSDGAVWTYSKKYGEYSDETPVYQLRKDGQKCGVIYLKKSEEKGRFLTNGWNVDKITDMCLEQSTYTVTAPSNAIVTINGMIVGEEYITESDIGIELLDNMTDIIESPSLVTYTVSGLYNKPDIAAVGGVYGKSIQPVVTDNDYVFGFESTNDFISSVNSRVKTITEAYCNYVGAAKSVTTLTGYFLPNSNGYKLLVNSAEGYQWNFYTDYDVNIKEISDYQIYSDSCFSCTASISMSVKRSSLGRDYEVNITYVFYKKNGIWLVADFVLE